MEQEFLSLFDYLKKPAGGDLGKKVSTQARLQKQPFKVRKISNSKYTGDVLLYTREFLDSYFKSSYINDNHPTF